MIVNGNELGGGSFRIHEPDIQAQVFDLLAPHRGAAAREVRLPARRTGDGRAAARRHRARHRPDDDGARRRAEPARRDRVPEEPGGPRPDVGGPVADHAGSSSTSSASGSSHPRRPRPEPTGRRRACSRSPPWRCWRGSSRWRSSSGRTTRTSRSRRREPSPPAAAGTTPSQRRARRPVTPSARAAGSR